MKTLLVLEDEPLLMTLMRHMLRDYKVIEAATSEEALLRFIDLDRQVDVLITDVTLPGMSGIQVALRLRLALPGLPVILTSGFPISDWSIRDLDDLQELGANGAAIIQKPFQKKALLSAVCQSMEMAQPAKVRTASTAVVG